MKITTKGRYALRVMSDLALNYSDKFIPLSDISKRQGVSSKYLEQIIALLNKAGFLETARGNNGGYKLSRKPNEYLVGDILRATEGDLMSIYCKSGKDGCENKDKCKRFSFWDGLDKVITQYVDSKTLADII